LTLSSLREWLDVTHVDTVAHLLGDATGLEPCQPWHECGIESNVLPESRNQSMDDCLMCLSLLGTYTSGVLKVIGRISALLESNIEDPPMQAHLARCLLDLRRVVTVEECKNLEVLRVRLSTSEHSPNVENFAHGMGILDFVLSLVAFTSNHLTGSVSENASLQSIAQWSQLTWTPSGDVYRRTSGSGPAAAFSPQDCDSFPIMRKSLEHAAASHTPITTFEEIHFDPAFDTTVSGHSMVMTNVGAASLYRMPVSGDGDESDDEELPCVMSSTLFHGNAFGCGVTRNVWATGEFLTHLSPTIQDFSTSGVQMYRRHPFRETFKAR
jgi:hypothetical protein